MYPVVILPTAPLVSSSPYFVSLTANVGISLWSSRPTNTPHLTPAKSRTSLPAKLSTLPMTRSPLSKMAARASRVQSIPGQIQRQAPAISSMKPVDHSPVSPHPPPPPPIVPSRSQLRVDRVGLDSESRKEKTIGNNGEVSNGLDQRTLKCLSLSLVSGEESRKVVGQIQMGALGPIEEMGTNNDIGSFEPSQGPSIAYKRNRGKPFNGPSGGPLDKAKKNGNGPIVSRLDWFGHKTKKNTGGSRKLGFKKLGGTKI
ncbi:hypothetical protein LWI28_024905 [Acer negundo]|uniref:Uncharacterized protein n=1 Tax=Acer negundo TaxID=4023 RepID=A0AAD5P1D3_ACENE|nr:hypothetical protein LWI28_024905 [Acer negundo]